QECDERGASARRELQEAVARRTALAVVGGDRVLERASAAIVHIGRAEGDAPERRRAKLPTRRDTLLDAVTEHSHVVQEEVGEQAPAALAERRKRARARSKLVRVARVAAELPENALARARRRIRLGGPERREQAHEIGEGLDVAAVVLRIGHRIAQERPALR